MSSEQLENGSESPSQNSSSPDRAGDGERSSANDRENTREADRHEAMILVRGESIRDQHEGAPPKDDADRKAASDKKDKEDGPDKPVSREKVEAQSRLPALDDDADVGEPKAHTVTRDGEADLVFTGTLLASAAPASAPKGEWKEYRIYETSAGKHVFSKITRKVLAEEQDSHEATVFDPSPSSMPSRLLKTAHDLTHTRPVLWTDAAVDFFGYDPLAKSLYQKFGTQFEEQIS